MADPFTTYKLIVLYMAKHATQALTNSQISEFILDREYTDYFQLQKSTVRADRDRTSPQKDDHEQFLL